MLATGLRDQDNTTRKIPSRRGYNEGFGVIKSTKFVQKTSAKTSVYDSICFSRDYNRTSSQMKKIWGGRGFSECFSTVCFISA